MSSRWDDDFSLTNSLSLSTSGNGKKTVYKDGKFYTQNSDGSLSPFSLDSDTEEDFENAEPDFHVDRDQFKRIQRGRPAGLRTSLPDVNLRTPVPPHRDGVRQSLTTSREGSVNPPADQGRYYTPLVNKTIDSNAVKYVRYTDYRMLKYGVKIGQTMTRRGCVFDTGSIRNHFSSKDRQGKATIGRNRLASATASQAEALQIFKDMNKDWANSLIFVCSKEDQGPTFFSHVCKLHRFHHSSFTAGDDLIGAGEWVVEKGALRRISGNSGHYQPTLIHLIQTIRLLESALRPDTEVMLWDVLGDKWTYVNAQTFLGNPYAGNYKVHPNT